MRWFAFLVLVLTRSALAQVPDSTFDFVEVQPVLIGGIESLQRGIVYPTVELQSRVQGRVIVQFVVDEHGTPGSLEIVRRVSPGLDAAAFAAVQRARFTPGTQEGRPVKTRFSLPVRFQIAGMPAPHIPALDVLPGVPWRNMGTASPDSGTVLFGWGRLIFLSPTAGTERIEVVVRDGLIAEINTKFLPDSSLADISGRTALLDQLSRSTPRPDGYFHATDLVELGFASQFDIAVDETATTYRTRAPRCATSSPHLDCISMFPMLLGGVQGVIVRARFPANVDRPFPEGRIEISMGVDGLGRVFNAQLVSNSAVGPSGQGIAGALLDAVRGSQFVVDPGLDQAQPVRVSLPFTFRSDG